MYWKRRTSIIYLWHEEVIYTATERSMPPEKIGLGCQICPLWELFKLWLHKNYCFHKNHLTCNRYRKIWWSTEHFRVKSLLFLVFCRPPKKGTICVLWAHSGHSRKNGGQSVKEKGREQFWPKKGNLRRTRKNWQNFTPFRVNKMFSIVLTHLWHFFFFLKGPWK
jgi:hypothetical protein